MTRQGVNILNKSNGRSHSGRCKKTVVERHNQLMETIDRVAGMIETIEARYTQSKSRWCAYGDLQVAQGRSC